MPLPPDIDLVLKSYDLVSNNIIPKFKANPESLELREKIKGPDGRPMLEDPAGVVLNHLYRKQRTLEDRLKGVIPITENANGLEQLQNAEPQPLLTPELYADASNEYLGKLSPEGMVDFYNNILQSEHIQEKLSEIVRENEPAKWKEFLQHRKFAGTIDQYLQNGNMQGLIAYIKSQAGGAPIASLMTSHFRYGNPDNAAAVARDIQQVALNRMLKMYEESGGTIANAVESAIAQTGTLGYADAIVLMQKLYESDGEKKYRKDAEEAEKQKTNVIELRGAREKKAQEAQLKAEFLEYVKAAA